MLQCIVCDLRAYLFFFFIGRMGLMQLVFKCLYHCFRRYKTLFFCKKVLLVSIDLNVEAK